MLALLFLWMSVNPPSLQHVDAHAQCMQCVRAHTHPFGGLDPLRRACSSRRVLPLLLLWMSVHPLSSAARSRTRSVHATARACVRIHSSVWRAYPLQSPAAVVLTLCSSAMPARVLVQTLTTPPCRARSTRRSASIRTSLHRPCSSVRHASRAHAAARRARAWAACRLPALRARLFARRV